MIHIRTAQRTDAAAIARVHAATWKEAYRGLLDSQYLDNMGERRLTSRWRTQLDRREQDLDEEVLVALVGREVVGFAAVSASREAFAPWDAEITMIYVLKEHRGSGIGRGADEGVGGSLHSAGAVLGRAVGVAGQWRGTGFLRSARRRADGTQGRQCWRTDRAAGGILVARSCDTGANGRRPLTCREDTEGCINSDAGLTYVNCVLTVQIVRCEGVKAPVQPIALPR